MIKPEDREQGMEVYIDEYCPFTRSPDGPKIVDKMIPLLGTIQKVSSWTKTSVTIGGWLFDIRDIYYPDDIPQGTTFEIKSVLLDPKELLC